MATFTSNYAWTKPAGSDPVDISVLNDNLDSQDGIIHDAFLNMADPFSESSTYAVGNIVVYGTKTYKCHTAVTTAGSWTGSTNWQVYKLSEGGSGGGSTTDYLELDNKPQINGNELRGNKTSADLGLQSELTAGNYVNIQNGVINVQTEIGTYNYVRYEMESTGGGNIKLIVRKYVNNVLDSTTKYPNDGQHHEIDDVMDTWYEYGPYLWHYKLLVASTDHAVGYEESWSYQDTSVHTVNFQFAQDDSTTLVTKGDLDDADGDIYAVMGQMGAKNLIPYPYYADTEEDRGITWTNQSNGWVVATGTASADSAHNLSLRTVENGIYLPNGTYILNGCPSDGSDSTYYLEAVITKNSSAFRLGIDSGSGVEIEITGDDFSNDGAYVMIRGIVKNAYAIQSSLTLKPMLRLATDTDDTYQPYAKTNKQLTDEIDNKVNKVEGKGLSTNDYDNAEKAEVAKVAGKADKTATASGETLALVPTSEGRALLHTAYGMSTQSGTPTPSSPVDIESSKVDLRSVGKNLVPYPFTNEYMTNGEHTRFGITYEVIKGGIILKSGKCTSSTGSVQRFIDDAPIASIGLEIGKQYILSAKKSGYDNTTPVTLRFYNSSSEIIDTITTSTGADVLFTVPENSVVCRMYEFISANETLGGEETILPMLRMAAVTDNNYEYYQKNDVTTDLTLRAIEVTSSDAYNLVRDNKYYIADTLDYSEDNGFVVTRRIGHIASYDSESLTTKWMSSKDVYASGTNPSSGATVDYILATPTTETITTAQALALLGLKTYDESTTISSQAEPSCTIAVEYAKERLGALALTAYNTAKGNDLRITALEG